jgi:hypothetical protein
LQARELAEHNALCLAGEEVHFINKYLQRTFSAHRLPLTFHEGFGDK